MNRISWLQYRSRLLAVAGAMCLAAGARAQAPLTISGVADRTIYSESVTFTIALSNGYDYAALVDTNPVAIGSAVTVSSYGYHDLYVWRTNIATLATSNAQVKFIVRASERSNTEDGIPPWTPYPPVPATAGECAGAGLRLLAPKTFPAGYGVPVVCWVEKALGQAIRVCGTVTAPGQPGLKILRGVGSGFVNPTNASGSFTYPAAMAGLQTNQTIQIEAGTVWSNVGGNLAGAVVWPAQSRITVTNQLTVPAGASLSIGAGAIVRIASGVEITNDGSIFISGTREEPVVFMPTNAANPWGGFLLQSASSVFTATGAIFTGSGAVAAWFGSNGHPASHRTEEALFFINSTPTLVLEDCAAISLAGQFGHAVAGGTFQFRRLLVERATSAGQYGGAFFTVADSAFIEFPDDSVNFVDGDNDALYIEDSFHTFTNTLIGWTKDDGVDSGGSGAGVLTFNNCWFESTFHEGNSLSGTGKNSYHFDDVFVNCGQALESGYSGPTGYLIRCFSSANMVGCRYGDNYSSGYTYSGFMRATNSIIIGNLFRDVWGMRFLTTDWTYRTNAMDIQMNYLSAPNASHTNNLVWNPAADGFRIAPYMTIPQTANVGIGLALRSNSFLLARLSNALPVRLSHFTTNVVSVDWSADGGAGSLTNGTLVFTPGETLKFIPLAAALTNAGQVRLALRNPVRSEITGVREAWFSPVATNNPLAPVTLISTGAVWKYLDNGTDQGTAWRATNFDDSAWASGPAMLGYGDANGILPATTNSYGPSSANKYITTYYRRTLNVANPAAFASYTVSLQRDDGGVVYANGTEIFRSNMPTGTIGYLTRAASTVSTTAETTFYATNLTTIPFVAGANVVAVEIHQDTTNSSDIAFDLAIVGTPATPTNAPDVLFQKFATDTVVVWSDANYALESAPDVAGPWTLDAASSPVTVGATNVQRFFRLRK